MNQLDKLGIYFEFKSHDLIQQRKRIKNPNFNKEQKQAISKLEIELFLDQFKNHYLSNTQKKQVQDIKNKSKYFYKRWLWIIFPSLCQSNLPGLNFSKAIKLFDMDQRDYVPYLKDLNISKRVFGIIFKFKDIKNINKEITLQTRVNDKKPSIKGKSTHKFSQQSCSFSINSQKKINSKDSKRKTREKSKKIKFTSLGDIKFDKQVNRTNITSFDKRYFNKTYGTSNAPISRSQTYKKRRKSSNFNNKDINSIKRANLYLEDEESEDSNRLFLTNLKKNKTKRSIQNKRSKSNEKSLNLNITSTNASSNLSSILLQKRIKADLEKRILFVKQTSDAFGYVKNIQEVLEKNSQYKFKNMKASLNTRVKELNEIKYKIVNTKRTIHEKKKELSGLLEKSKIKSNSNDKSKDVNLNKLEAVNSKYEECCKVKERLSIIIEICESNKKLNKESIQVILLLTARIFKEIIITSLRSQSM